MRLKAMSILPITLGIVTMTSKPITENILKKLKSSKNVLVSGPPGTGKSLLLSDIAATFLSGATASQTSGLPPHKPGAAVPIPAQTAVSKVPHLPAAAKTDRKVFRTVFHQNTRYRDMLNGLAPTVDAGTDKDFKITSGILYRASEHAKKAEGASLLIIDEINRGPAVQAFGGSIVAIEADKRLGVDGSATHKTQTFEIVDPSSGEMIEYALPDDLYILAAMNQADASVEPMDVAFLRRWDAVKLEPSEAVLRKFLGLEAKVEELPGEAEKAADIYEATVQAWKSINDRISLGRGREYQIGHGVLMGTPINTGDSVEAAIEKLSSGWSKVMAHVEEVFFGDLRGFATALNTDNPTVAHPIQIKEARFGGDLRLQVIWPESLSDAIFYKMLRSTVKHSEE